MTKETILLVDDREDDLFLLRRVFRKADLRNEIQTVSKLTQTSDGRHLETE